MMFFRQIAKILNRPLWVASFFLLADWLLLLSSYLFLLISEFFFETHKNVFFEASEILHNLWWWGHKDVGNHFGPMMFPIMVNHPPIPSMDEFFIFEVLCTFKFFFLGLVLSLLFKLARQGWDKLARYTYPQPHPVRAAFVQGQNSTRMDSRSHVYMRNYSFYGFIAGYLLFCSACIFKYSSPVFDAIAECLKPVYYGFFFMRIKNAYVFLMLFLMFLPLQSFVMYVLIKCGNIKILTRISIFFLLFSIIFVLVAYIKTGLSPFFISAVS
jgi:hypothetical protein